jgi:hypothetical protein
MPAAQKYLTPAELIARWGGSHKRGTLANWRSQGKGPPFVKRGAKALYPLDRLEAWEAANDNETTTDKT